MFFPKPLILLGKVVLPKRFELLTSPLPRECSTTELRQPGRPKRGDKTRRKMPRPRGLGKTNRLALTRPMIEARRRSW